MPSSGHTERAVMQSFSRISAFIALVISLIASGAVGSPPPWPSWPYPPSAPAMPQGLRGMNPPNEFGIFFNYRCEQLQWYNNITLTRTPVRLDVVLVSYGSTPLYPAQGPHFIETFPGGRPAYYAQFIPQLQGIISSWITNAAYDGLIVLDYEFFSPWWTGHLNTPSTLGPDELDDDYIDDWRDTLRVTRAAQLAGLTPAQQEAYFKQEWLSTTREFFERVYNAVKTLRPLAKVGIYNQPAQTYWGWLNPTSAAAMHAGHDEVPWFWQMVDVILPSIYAFYKSVPDFRAPGPNQDRESSFDAYCRANIGAALRIANGKPVYPYVSFQYHPSNPAYAWQPVNDFNLRQALAVSREMGCNGVVVWAWIKTQTAYDQIAPYMSATLDPYLQRMATLPAYAPANPARPQRTN